MQIGVADAAEEDFDLNVVLGWIATRDCCGGQRRCRAACGVSLRLVHGFVLLVVPYWPSLRPGIVRRRHVPSIRQPCPRVVPG